MSTVEAHSILESDDYLGAHSSSEYSAGSSWLNDSISADQIGDLKDQITFGKIGAPHIAQAKALYRKIHKARSYQRGIEYAEEIPFRNRLGGPAYESPVEDVVRFNRLCEDWRRDTCLLSSVTDICMHTAYQQIIGMGERAVPLILEELRERPDQWFWALSAITGERPFPREVRGDVEAMSDAWLKWGAGHGYL